MREMFCLPIFPFTAIGNVGPGFIRQDYIVEWYFYVLSWLHWFALPSLSSGSLLSAQHWKVVNATGALAVASPEGGVLQVFLWYPPISGPCG